MGKMKEADLGIRLFKGCIFTYVFVFKISLGYKRLEFVLFLLNRNKKQCFRIKKAMIIGNLSEKELSTWVNGMSLKLKESLFLLCTLVWCVGIIFFGRLEKVSRIFEFTFTPSNQLNPLRNLVSRLNVRTIITRTCS